MEKRSFGWVPSIPDIRDLKFQVRYLTSPPSQVDLRVEMPPIYDQGTLGSCTANAGCTLWQHTRKKLNKPDLSPSRLFLYYNTRSLEGSIKYDSGASLRSTLKAMARWGVCQESFCPYDISRFAIKPSKMAFLDGEKHKASNYYSVPQHLQSMQACLAEGFGIVFGFSVYESFNTEIVAQTGKVPMPLPHERTLGGHAVKIVGYSDPEQHFIVRNSWNLWGDNGYCYMPYDFVLNPTISQDFWTLRYSE